MVTDFCSKLFRIVRLASESKFTRDDWEFVVILRVQCNKWKMPRHYTLVAPVSSDNCGGEVSLRVRPVKATAKTAESSENYFLNGSFVRWGVGDMEALICYNGQL